MHLIKSSTILALFLLCARWVSMGQSTVQTNGLVLHYPFNGSPQEILGNLPPPTTANLVAVPDRHGSVGSAYGFDGLNSTIAQPESVLNIGQTDYSISFGFKTDDVEKEHQGLINTIPHNGLYVVFNHPPFTGVLSFRVGNGDGWISAHTQGTKGNYQAGQWYHVTITKQGTEYDAYVDGELDSSIVVPDATTFDRGSGLRFGSISDIPNQSSQFLAGALDDIRVFDRSLSGTDARLLFYTDTGSSSSRQGDS